MSKVEIVPAILERDIAVIQERLESVRGIVPIVQVDVCDGIFVPSKTYGAGGSIKDFEQLSVLAQEHNLKIELDMMVSLGKDTTDRYKNWRHVIVASGAERVIFHMGTTDDWDDIVSTLIAVGVQVGLAVHIDSNMDEVRRTLDSHAFSFVQVMGIKKIGYGGQIFEIAVLELIDKIHGEYPDMVIAVDGGVTNDSALLIKEAGAHRLAAGSAIFTASNPQEAIEKLQGE